MKKLAYILCVLLIITACSKDNDPTEPDPDPPCEDCGNGEEPDPEYDPDTQILFDGLVWDKKIAADYCTYSEAVEIAKKEGKRIPNRKEWLSLFEAGYTIDEYLSGVWIGEDSELKSESKKSVFLGALGYMDAAFDYRLYSYGSFGKFWRLKDNNFEGYNFYASIAVGSGIVYHLQCDNTQWTQYNDKFSLLLVQ